MKAFFPTFSKKGKIVFSSIGKGWDFGVRFTGLPGFTGIAIE